jgi:polysaccharide export outer membrane protein
MKNNLSKTLSFCCLLFILIIANSSCYSTKRSVYFLNQPDTTLVTSNAAPVVIIHNNDLLSISVSSLSTQASSVFNSPNTSGTSTTNASGGSIQSTGYLVNNDGDIKFPFLGKIKAAGLTEQQLEETVTQSLIDKKLLLDPIVTVRHLNFKVTVLGEVNHPSVLTITSEKVSFLEAIGLAGDLTIYAKRDNVLLVREENNKKITRRINLNSSDFFASPYYYLKSNDVIYVEPNAARVASASRSQFLLPIVFSGLSFAAILFQVIRTN